MEASKTPDRKPKKRRYKSTYSSKQVTLRLPNKIVQKIGWKAADEEVTSGEIIRQILADAVKDVKPPMTLEYRGFSATDDEWQRWQDMADRCKVELNDLLRQVLERVYAQCMPK
jgi:hypothetical protein